MPFKSSKEKDDIKRANAAREEKLKQDMMARFRAHPEHYQHDMSQYSRSTSIKFDCNTGSGLLASPVSTRNLDLDIHSDSCFSDGEDDQKAAPKEQKMGTGNLRGKGVDVNTSGASKGKQKAALAQADNELRTSSGNHPDAMIREEVFTQLSWCGYLDQRQPHLIRWAVGLYWDLQLSKQRNCSQRHEVPEPIPLEGGGDCNIEPPPVLFRLFAQNAILPHHVRQSATTRALIILYALYYIANTPCCAICNARQHGSDMVDMRAETSTSATVIRNFDGWHPSVVARMTADWAAAIRCAVAYLVDSPREGYWRRYTCHIPTETGEAVTRYFQEHLGYQLNVPHERLITWMDTLTDFHPFAIAPKSNRKYQAPKNPKGDNIADLLSGLRYAGIHQ